MRIDRLLAMTVMMLNRERISARELAQKFEISIRTVYRDLDAMMLAGIPVVSYAGHGGGYGLQDNYKIDRRLLSHDDIKAILMSLGSIKGTLPAQKLDETIEKIASLLPAPERLNACQLEHIVIDSLSWGASHALNEKLALVQQAIAACHRLELEYAANSTGERSLRRVEPYTLFFKGYSWYVFAFCQMRRDFRFFRLTRCQALRCTDEPFVRQAVSYRDFLPQFAPQQPLLEIVLEFTASARQLAQDTFDQEQITELADGRTHVTVRMADNDMFYSMALGFGAHVTVIAPGQVRQKMREKIKKIAQLYKLDIRVSQTADTI